MRFIGISGNSFSRVDLIFSLKGCKVGQSRIMWRMVSSVVIQRLHFVLVGLATNL